MKQILTAILLIIMTCTVATAAPTVFFKDGSKETGNSLWAENGNLYLSKGTEIYQYSPDEVLMEKTERFNRLQQSSAKEIANSRPASTDSTSQGDVIAQLYQLNNLDSQIDTLTNGFSSGLNMSTGAGGELSDIVQNAVKKLDTSKLKRRARSYFRSHLDKKSAEAVMTWSRSPLGRKVTQLEKKNATMRFSDQGMESAPEISPAREALINELDRAARVSETAMQILKESIDGAVSALPKQQRNGKDLRKTFLEASNAALAEKKPQLRQSIHNTLINTYESLSDNELQQYINFLKTEPARKFTKTIKGIYSELTRSVSASISKEIFREMRKQNLI